jgi:hypothetical protein
LKGLIMTDLKITKTTVKKLLDVVDQGLCSGLGEPVPGSMCVEAAVCFSLGLPHGDNPGCVDRAVREFKIRLNDSSWSSKAARANGLRRLAVLQLGTDENFDCLYFVEQLAIRTIKVIIADMMESIDPAIAKECREVVTLNEAQEVSYKAYRASARASASARAAASASAAAAASASAAAADASASASARAYASARAASARASASARAAASASAAAAASASAAADADASASASARAYASASARAYASASAAAASAARAKVLLQSAKIAEDILIEMNVPGVKWLPLLDVTGA